MFKDLNEKCLKLLENHFVVDIQDHSNTRQNTFLQNIIIFS